MVQEKCEKTQFISQRHGQVVTCSAVTNEHNITTSQLLSTASRWSNAILLVNVDVPLWPIWVHRWPVRVHGRRSDKRSWCLKVGPVSAEGGTDVAWGETLFHRRVALTRDLVSGAEWRRWGGVGGCGLWERERHGRGSDRGDLRIAELWCGRGRLRGKEGFIFRDVADWSQSESFLFFASLQTGSLWVEITICRKNSSESHLLKNDKIVILQVSVFLRC